MRVELLPTTGGGGGATDHGALTGLTDDDHAHYLLATGLREWDEQGTDPTTPASGKWALYFKAGGLYYVDDAGAVTGPLGTGGGGSSTFLGLTDTPGSFSGLGLDLVRVNAGETALEAVDLGSIDHGSLGGQADDDHTQYVLATGLREWSEQGTDPTTPASGNWSLYFKAGGLYVQDDAGVVTGPLGTGGGGSSTFLGLTDAPSSYTGEAGKLARVNSGETALEFVATGSIDHAQLGSLGADDHAQYVLATGLREWSEQGTDPTTPASGQWALYFKAGGLYYIDDAGTVTGPLGAGGGGSAAWESDSGSFKADTSVIASGDRIELVSRETAADDQIAFLLNTENAFGTTLDGRAMLVLQDGGTEVLRVLRDSVAFWDAVQIAPGNHAEGGLYQNVISIGKGSASGGTNRPFGLVCDARNGNIGTSSAGLWMNAPTTNAWLNGLDFGVESGQHVSFDQTAGLNSKGDTYLEKSADTGGNFSYLYDGTEVLRDDGTELRVLAARGLGLFTAIGDTHAVVALSSTGVHWGPGGGTAADFGLVRASGELVLSGLPTTDPGVVGALWDDSGTLKISQ